MAINKKTKESALADSSPEFYSLTNILKIPAQYRLIIGERSNGKTYSVLKYGIEKYLSDGSQLAIIRRWADDFKGKRGATMFDGIVANGVIKKLTKGLWDRVYYYSGRWFFAKMDNKLKKIVYDAEPFAYAFALTGMEHDKSTSYPNIRTICFDEFLTRSAPLVDEFVYYMNVISTIVRYRDDVEIFMLGNTVNKDSPYFKEMGLDRVGTQAPGTIDVYKYGDSGLTVAVEYCKTSGKGKSKKASDVLFAFNNPKLAMITNGVWEMALYPHLTREDKYLPKNIALTFFIRYEAHLLRCDIVNKNDRCFMNITRMYHDLTRENEFVFDANQFTTNPYVFRNILKQKNRITQVFIQLYNDNRIFFQDNEVGESLRNYLMWCKTDSVCR